MFGCLVESYALRICLLKSFDRLLKGPVEHLWYLLVPSAHRLDEAQRSTNVLSSHKARHTTPVTRRESGTTNQFVDGLQAWLFVVA